MVEEGCSESEMKRTSVSVEGARRDGGRGGREGGRGGGRRKGEKERQRRDEVWNINAPPCCQSYPLPLMVS